MIRETILAITANYTTLFIFLTFASILFLFFLEFKEIKKQFKKIDKKIWFFLLLILLLSLYMRTTGPSCPTPTNKMWEYVWVAERMNNGEPLIDIGHPRGYSFLLAVIFLLFEANYANIVAYNILISSFTSVMVFLITYLISKNEYISLLSALTFSFLPTSIFFSQYCSAEISSVFFLGLTSVIFLISLDVKKTRMMTLALLLLVFSITMRLENTMFIPLFLLGYIPFLKKNEFKKLIIPVSIFFIFMLQLTGPYILSPYRFGYIRADTDPSLMPPGSQRGEIEWVFDEQFPWIEKPDSFSLLYLPLNLKVNAENLNDNRNYPTFLFLFIFISIFGIRRYPKVIIPVLWILIFFLFYGTYWASWITSGELYQLLLLIPLSVLVSMGVLVLYQNFQKFFSKFRKYRFMELRFMKWQWWQWIFIIFIIFYFVFSISSTGILKPKSMECLTKDIEYVSPLLEKNSCILLTSYSNSLLKNPTEMIKYIIQDKKLEQDPVNCEGMKTYYLKIKSMPDIPGSLERLEDCDLTQIMELETILIYDLKC